MLERVYSRQVVSSQAHHSGGFGEEGGKGVQMNPPLGPRNVPLLRKRV